MIRTSLHYQLLLDSLWPLEYHQVCLSGQVFLIFI